jgi:GntR family transcriptional regulator
MATNSAAHASARPRRRVAAAAALVTPDPLYKQVRTALVESLASGEWKPGEMIPSERKLADRYGVAVATVRAAVGDLAATKVLARRQGKGTFVCREEERRSVYQFFHIVRDDGVKELPVSELVSLRPAHADYQLAHALQLPRRPAAQRVWRIRNVLTVSGTPVVVSDIAIPAAMFPGLTEQWVRKGGPTLYAVYQSRFGISIIRTDEELRAVRCDAGAARLLRLGPGEPILEIRRTAYTFNDVPVEVRKSRLLTRNYHYALSHDGR